MYDVFMSPGSVTERLHFYAASYTADTRTADGGGLADEGEEIDVLDIPFDESLAMIRDGRICDAKTIMLLHWAALDGPFAGEGRRNEGDAHEPPHPSRLLHPVRVDAARRVGGAGTARPPSRTS